MCRSGSTKLLNTDPIPLRIHSTGWKRCWLYLGELVPGDEGVERLGEVKILDPAVGAAHRLAVVREEVEPLVGVDHQLAAVRTLHRDNKTSLNSTHNCTKTPRITPQHRTEPEVQIKIFAHTLIKFFDGEIRILLLIKKN